MVDFLKSSENQLQVFCVFQNTFSPEMALNKSNLFYWIYKYTWSNAVKWYMSVYFWRT